MIHDWWEQIEGCVVYLYFRNNENDLIQRLVKNIDFINKFLQWPSGEITQI